MSVGVRVRVCLAVVGAMGWTVCLRAQSEGLPPEWEVRKDLESLVEQTGRLKPLLDAVKPGEWIQKGAPAAYQGQWKSVQAESDYLVRSAGELAKSPERLTIALETYLRLQSRDALLVSLIEGIAKYQNPALADLVRGVMVDGAAAGDKLRQYVVRLAALKEGQLSVADQEAQRCRSMLLKQPAPKSQGKPGSPK
jgi:hypothetical protein